MLAIFTSEIEAVTFSAKIHNFLTKNRSKYSAAKWSNLNKSDKEDKWFVKVPEDYRKWPVKLDIKEVTELVPTIDIKVYLKDWYPITEIIEKVIKR